MAHRLKRPECRPQSNYRNKPEKGADDRNHNNVQIAFTMGRAADREQGHHGAVVRQTVERACANYGDAVHQRWIDALLRSKAHIGATKRVERDRQSARGRTSERREHIGRDGQ
jgi:hypothetical protein